MATSPVMTSADALANYAAAFRRECVEGSAIAPALFDVAIDVRPEMEQTDWGEPDGWPIHQALGWKEPARFWQTRRPHEFQAGAFFNDTRVDTWQIKPQNPRLDPKKGKPVKYETPKGLRAAYFPPVPKTLQAKILRRQGHIPHGVLDPTPLTDPNKFFNEVVIPGSMDLVLTEGGKKCLCGISHGHATVALAGVYNGYTKDPYALRPDIAELATEGRKITIAFDQDKKPSTRHKVNLAISRLGRLLTEVGLCVYVATWNHTQGKGLDDLVVQSGASALHRAIEDALPFANWERQFKQDTIAWRLRHRLRHRDRKSLTALVDLDATEANLLGLIPTTGVVAIKSPTGTGKTQLAKKLLANVDGVIAPGNRESLQRGLGQRLGLDYIADVDAAAGYYINSKGDHTRKLSLCWDSIRRIQESDYPPGSYDLLLDEADQGWEHVLMGETCGKGGKRPAIQAKAIALVKGARRVILASAGLSDREIDLVCEIRGDEQPWVLENRPTMTGYPCELYTDSPGGGDRKMARAAVTAKLIQALERGDRIIVHTDTKMAARIIAEMGIQIGKLTPDQVLRFDGDTSPEPLQRSFADDPNGFLSQHNIKLLVASPSMTSGVSIEGDFFDVVFGFFEGKTILPSEAMQALHRYRRLVPRCVFAAAYGKGGSLPAFNALDFTAKQHEQARLISSKLMDAELLGQLDLHSPTSRYVAQCRAEHHRAMCDFALYLQAELTEAGHMVTEHRGASQSSDQDRALNIHSQIRKEVKASILEEKANAPLISAEAIQKLRDQKALTYEQRLLVNKFDVCEFYGLTATEADVEMMEYDHDGDMRQGLRFLCDLIVDSSAQHYDKGKVEQLRYWNHPIAPHDLPKSELKRWTAEALGLKDAIAAAIECSESGEGWNNDTVWLKDLQTELVKYTRQIKLIFGETITASQPPCKSFGMLVRRLTKGALKTKSRQETINGKRVRILHLYSRISLSSP